MWKFPENDLINSSLSLFLFVRYNKPQDIKTESVHFTIMCICNPKKNMYRFSNIACALEAVIFFSSW